MNYTGRPSISGCRPVLSLYPTHRFCQYLLLIFITFTNSFLFNRAFSTNSRRPLRRAAGVTAPGCALSGASRQLPQRESPWQAGSLSTGRLRLDRTQKSGPCLRGQRLLDNAPRQAVAGLDSGALLLPRYCASLVQTKADRHANGSPFGATATTAASGGNREELLGQRPAGCERQRSRRWEPQPGLGEELATRLRGQGCGQTALHSDRQALCKKRPLHFCSGLFSENQAG